jgi:uncharacterized protein with von Willebrand factor type A (vWA) domain
VKTHALFAGVDRAIFAASFADRLRHAGVDVSFSALERCTNALDVAGPMTLSDLYWVCRLSFVNGHSQLDRFDAVFGAVFDTEAGTLRAERRGQEPLPSSRDDEQLIPLRRQLADESTTSGGLPWATLPSISFDDADDADDSDDLDDLVIPELRPTATESEMQRPFDLLDEAELARVGAVLESAVTQWPQRRTRRRRTTRSTGPIAVRRSLRRSMHTGGDVMTWLHSTPQRQPRNIVVLLDVSASMEHYARAYLHLIRPLAIEHRAEIFAFATSLSRITPAVRHRSPSEAIAQVTDAVTDRFSGTRLATSLQTLLHHRTWNTTVRGAVVLICSDGWDADTPEQLERNMKRLSLLAHRVIWVNPRAAATEFEPSTAGMSAALPYCDRFLAGNSGDAMIDVVEAMTAT